MLFQIEQSGFGYLCYWVQKQYKTIAFYYKLLFNNFTSFYYKAII